MSVEVKEQSEEAAVAQDFKRFVRRYLFQDVSTTERTAKNGTWELDSKGQLSPMPVNCIGFTAMDLDVYPDDPQEHIAADGHPKQEMSVTVGRVPKVDDGTFRDPLYELTFYERAVDDPAADPAFNLYFMGRHDAHTGVGPKVVRQLMDGITDLEAQGKLIAAHPALPTA